MRAGRRQVRTLAGLCAATAVAGFAIPGASSGLPVDPTRPAARDTEPVIMTGKDFAPWSTASNVTAKAPATDLAECQSFDEQCKHNNYAKPEVDSQELAKLEGAPVDRLLGYRWDAKRRRFEQIPFQVDEMFTRYLDNSASGFSVYSGQDRHTSYAFDREGFRYTKSDPRNPCLARPDSETARDPVPGLDDDDELAFMATDAGTEAPAGTALPKGVEEARIVRLVDSTRPAEAPRFVYVMRAGEGGPRAAFTARNGYVRYRRDGNADLFEKSESSYDGYGNAARGQVCDADGNVVAQNERRRPRDYATVTTRRYRFRYDGRWLMTQVQIAPRPGARYGPDLVDRWKARAFQQDPSSETPCCGYEEEDTNWGGSSTLLGERSGPVRTIRETWGADSGTNVIRRETFYRDEVRQKSYLRVHVIPPLDGIYAQWDFNAGRMTRYYTSAKPDGVQIDGRNDEVAGNLDDPCNGNYDASSNPNDTSDVDQGYRNAYRSFPGLCGGEFPYHQSVDVADPTLGELNSGLQWNVTSGPHGTIVDRYQIDRVTDQTPGGAAQNLAAVPYYRDDSCFDDGTGTDPGPRVKLRSSSEPREYVASDGSTRPRKCWATGDGLPDGSERHYQGSIGTHGLHILFLAESDNARQTVPLTEIVGEQRLVMLPGQRDGGVGETYGRGFEKPLVAASLPAP